MAGLPVQVQPVSADGFVVGGKVLYFGANVVENAGAVATVNIHDGEGTGGKIIDRFSLAAAGESRGGPTSRGVICESGIWVEIATGSAYVVVYYMPEMMLDAMAIIDFAGSQRYVHRYMTMPDIYRGFEETEP